MDGSDQLIVTDAKNREVQDGGKQLKEVPGYDASPSDGVHLKLVMKPNAKGEFRLGLVTCV